MWKKTMTVVVCGSVTLALGTGCNKKGESVKVEAPKADKAVAVKAPAPTVDPAATLVDVGGIKLTVGDADKQIKAMMGANAGKMDPAQMEAMMGRFRQRAAEQFVVRTLLSQEADRRAIKVVDKDIDEAIAMIKERLPKEMTLDEVMKRESMTLDQLRSNLVGEIRIKLLVETVVPTNTVVADADVTAFYNEQKDSFVQPETVAARHILVKFDVADTNAAKAAKEKIDGIRKQLVAGGDFAKLAKENSDCPSKEKGGELGQFPRGQMVKAFEDVAFSLATNEISAVVETQFGYHLIQVTGHAMAKTNDLSEVKDRLVQHLKQKKQMELFDTFLAKLKSESKIVYSDLLKQEPEMPMMPSAQ